MQQVVSFCSICNNGQIFIVYRSYLVYIKYLSQLKLYVFLQIEVENTK